MIPPSAIPTTIAPEAAVRGGALAPALCVPFKAFPPNSSRRRCHAKRWGAGFFGGIVALLLAGPVQAAAPPVGSEDYELMHDYADWVSSLAVGGVLCCSLADGRPVSARQRGEHWQVRFRPGQLAGAPTEWTDVPDKAVHRGPNPTGVPIAWFYGGSIKCFAPAGQY